MRLKKIVIERIFKIGPLVLILAQQARYHLNGKYWFTNFLTANIFAEEILARGKFTIFSLRKIDEIY